MSNPWDPPPLPEIGDLDEDETNLGVGRVISNWEFVEFHLARLFSVFMGRPDEIAALHTYGQGRIFRERKEALEVAAEGYFTRKPSQAFEAEFDDLLSHTIGFADRRNDVAHGIVTPISGFPNFASKPSGRDREHYALVPPLHTLRRYESTGTPLYVYTLPTLTRLAVSLLQLQGAINRLHKRLPRL